MTGNLSMMIKFRDIQVMEDVSKKAALGYFDVEFTMYGCAYLDPEQDKVYYKVSSKSEEIYSFIEESAKEGIYPSKVETMTVKCPVPLGARELIANDVKKELAKELQKKYSKEFLAALHQAAEDVCVDTAATLLWKRADELEGVFDEELLNRFEELVEYSYSCLKVSKGSYAALLRWIAAERQSMEDSFVSKDKLEKTFYGFGYIENGKLKYFTNANRSHVYEKLFSLEQNGVFVLPLYQKTYWYNFSANLRDITQRFCDAAYLETIHGIKTVSEDTQAVWGQKLEAIEAAYGEDAMLTVKRYLHRWGYFFDS